jgi:hypothetical protein
MAKEFAMKRKRFSVEQIVVVLKQAELGLPVAELIRQVGISLLDVDFFERQAYAIEFEFDGVGDGCGRVTEILWDRIDEHDRSNLLPFSAQMFSHPTHELEQVTDKLLTLARLGNENDHPARRGIPREQIDLAHTRLEASAGLGTIGVRVNA